jgi:hypothetical protein
VYSDARLKKIVTPMSGTLDRLLSLRAYEFDYVPEAIETGKGRPGRQFGLLAQDVERVFPDWVERDPQGYLYVTERASTALLVEALHELREENDREIALRDTALADLRERMDRFVAELEARIRRLESRVSASPSSP